MSVNIETKTDGGTTVVALQGDVDLYSSPQLRAAIVDAMAGGAVAVDLRAAAYMDSSGAATLVEGLKKANLAKTPFILLAPSAPVMKVLQLSRLDTLFEIRANP